MSRYREGVQSGILARLGLESLPKGCVFLFQGPSGSGKTILTDSILVEQLNRGLNAVLLTLNRSPADVRESLREMGWFDPQRPIIVDGYSCIMGDDTRSDRYELSSLSNLSDISIMVSKLLSVVGEGSLFAFDHLSTLLIHNEEIQVVRLLQTLVARIREAHDLAIVIFESGIHTQSFYNAVRLFVDCVMDFKIEEVEGFLYKAIRVNNARFPVSDSRWHLIDVMGNGKIIIQPLAPSKAISSDKSNEIYSMVEADKNKP